MIGVVPFLPAALFGLPTWAGNLILIGVILAVVITALAVIRWLVPHLMARSRASGGPRARQRLTAVSALATGLRYLVLITAAVAIASILGGGGGLAALGGGALLVVVIGFASQRLLVDVIAGFFILFEDQYGVGDIIEINQTAAGTVETLTLRVTGLRALDGTLHYISNGNITHVANRSKDWARAIVDVGVAYREEPAKIRRVLDDVATEAKEDEFLGKILYSTPNVMGVETLGEYEVVWRLSADTKPGRQWEAARTLREKIQVAFEREGVEIPFPHRVMISAEAGDSKVSRS